MTIRVCYKIYFSGKACECELNPVDLDITSNPIFYDLFTQKENSVLSWFWYEQLAQGHFFNLFKGFTTSNYVGDSKAQRKHLSDFAVNGYTYR